MLLDPTTTEIIRNSLVYASEEMGIALRNTSYSPNIRERMDHSAAIFDEEGRLQSPRKHIRRRQDSLRRRRRHRPSIPDPEKLDYQKRS